MRNTFPFLLILLWVLGCSLEEESISTDPGLRLLYSSDTVAFDTLLSARRSSTMRLSVYNPNRSALQINSIALGLGASSDYALVINGQVADAVDDQVVLAGDSLLILVEVNVDPRDIDELYLVKDSIVFRYNGITEHVKLVTYAQDSRRRLKATICDETWTNDRPYIISDSLFVAEDCQLTIEAGTKVYFENNAALFIAGTLKAVGDSADHIVFRNTRFDGVFDQVPGQWNGIYFLEGSTGNEVIFSDILNGQIGLRVGTPDEDNEPDVRIANTSIYNMSIAGILAFTSDIIAENTLIYNCGSYLAGNFIGGNYTYRHCTFSNEPSFFVRDEPSVQVTDNIVTGAGETLIADVFLLMENCIVWGPGQEELLLSNGGGANFVAQLSGNILKSREEVPGNFNSQEFNFPGFREPNLFDYSLDTLAFAKDKGIDTGILTDIVGARRDANPDIGAFERIEN